jgi:nucleoside-diphosphate-sugar epimerase
VLSGEKILVTGPAGQIAFPICETLARDNEVWGIARFTQPESKDRVESLGVTARRVDLGEGDLADIPDDFTYVLHLAALIPPGEDYDSAIRVNAEGTGLLLAHCRRAKAALVMSTCGVYKPHEDPWHAYVETDPLGDSQLPAFPTYSVSKLSEEAVARTCARLFDLPMVIARMNAAYGPAGGVPAFHLNAIAAGETVRLRFDPSPYSLIHERDIIEQLPAMLAAASTPATIVNWGGDQPVAAQEWCTYIGELLGVSPNVEIHEAPGSQKGVVADRAKRISLVGECGVDWREGVRELVQTRGPGTQTRT